MAYSEELQTAANQPKVYEAGGEKIEQHSLTQRMQLEDRAATQEAVHKKQRGLLFSKVKLPGTT